MPLVTFTSDFGSRDHYLGQVKGIMLSESPEQTIVDISHQVVPYDVTHMSFLLGNVFRNFPEGTIHFVGQDDENGYLIAWIEGHYFVAPNNGVISLINDRKPELLIAIDVEKNTLKTAAEVAIKLAKGELPETFGAPATTYKEFTKRKAKATKKEIAGHVIRVDRFGNLITNIEWTDFQILSRDRSYTLRFGRESLAKVNSAMKEVEPGDVFAQFNELEKLVIGIYQGNGAQLLGLEFDSPVTIIFAE